MRITFMMELKPDLLDEHNSLLEAIKVWNGQEMPDTDSIESKTIEEQLGYCLELEEVYNFGMVETVDGRLVIEFSHEIDLDLRLDRILAAELQDPLSDTDVRMKKIGL